MSETNLQRAIRRHNELVNLDHALGALVAEYAARRGGLSQVVTRLVGVLRDSGVIVERLRRLTADFPELRASSATHSYAQRLLTLADKLAALVEQYVIAVRAIEAAYGVPAREVVDKITAQKRDLRSGALKRPSGDPPDVESATAKLEQLEQVTSSVDVVETMTGEPYTRLSTVIAAYRRMFQEFVDALGAPAAAMPA